METFQLIPEGYEEGSHTKNWGSGERGTFIAKGTEIAKALKQK